LGIEVGLTEGGMRLLPMVGGEKSVSIHVPDHVPEGEKELIKGSRGLAVGDKAIGEE